MKLRKFKVYHAGFHHRDKGVDFVDIKADSFEEALPMAQDYCKLHNLGKLTELRENGTCVESTTRTVVIDV